MKIRYVVTGEGIEPEPGAEVGLVRGRNFDDVVEAVEFGREHAREYPSGVPVMVTEEILLEDADVPLVPLYRGGEPVTRADDTVVMVPDHEAIRRMLRTRLMWNSRQINDDHVAPPLSPAARRERLGA